MENHKDILKGFTKQEIINYLDVKDRLTDAKNNMIITEKIDYTNMMLYSLPIILILIFILVLYLVFKKNANNSKEKKYIS